MKRMTCALLAAAMMTTGIAAVGCSSDNDRDSYRDRDTRSSRRPARAGDNFRDRDNDGIRDGLEDRDRDGVRDGNENGGRNTRRNPDIYR
jgi:hypothetical protein